MASHDSGVDTSNDSCCNNDNSNSANSSINSDRSDYPVMEGLRLAVQKFTSFPSTAQDGSTSAYKTPSPHIHINKITRFSPRNITSRRYQHHNTTRNALIPYVCKLPNERKLRLAASVSNVELLLRLLDNGENPNSADEHLRSPLHLAASRGYKDVVKILLARGANPNQQDSLGNTPLHLAVCSASSYNFNMVVRILLQHGARVNILDRSGKTPLDLAKSKLLLMRTRLGIGTTPESAKLFVEMSMLTGVLHKTLTQQRKDVEQFDDLETRLRNLTTKEIEDEADNLLVDVAGLKLD